MKTYRLHDKSSLLLALVGLLAVCVCGCSPGVTPASRRPLVDRLQDDNPSVRVRAIVEAGETEDASAVPLLIDRLEDDDSDIRLFSIQALRRITGRDFDYRYYAPLEQRREAVARWRQWQAQQQGGPEPIEQEESS